MFLTCIRRYFIVKNLKQPSVKRWNQLLAEWVIIAPVTAGRPWSGTVVSPKKNNLPGFDPECYLCPGVKRAGGEVNPDYKDVYIFDNDFPSLSMEYSIEDYNMYHLQDTPARGSCRVVCFSPKHNITLPEMEVKDISKVLTALCEQFRELSSIPEIECYDIRKQGQDYWSFQSTSTWTDLFY